MIEAKFRFLNENIFIRGYSEDDWIFNTIDRYKTFYEIDLLKYMKFALRESDGYIIDIGANIGNHSVFFGLIMNRKVVCFEPNPPVFKLLEYNLKKNNIEYISYQIGLGSASGQYDIDSHHQAAESNIGAAKLCKNSSGKIIVKRLDDILKDIKYKDEKIDAIKADIEGMEAEMLKGSMITLNEQKPDLFLEINDTLLMKEIEDILYPIGYKRLYAYAGTPVWHFSHESKLSFMRIFELSFYNRMTRLKHGLGKLWRSILKQS